MASSSSSTNPRTRSFAEVFRELQGKKEEQEEQEAKKKKQERKREEQKPDEKKPEEQKQEEKKLQILISVTRHDKSRRSCTGP